MAWLGFVELRGLNGKTTRKTWKMRQTGTDGPAFVAAQAALLDVMNSLSDITDARVNDYGVTFVTEFYDAGNGDLTEQALLNVWAEDPANAGDVLAVSQVYVPAPKIGLFMATSGSNMDIVDVNDADLQTYIDSLAASVFISDNEVIDTGAATNGIENGRRVTRKSL